MTNQLRGIVAVIRSTFPIDFEGVGEALIRGGVTNLEVTLNTPGALAGISKLRKSAGTRAIVGAGTVLKSAEAQPAIDAGAEFVVTPTLQLGTIDLCLKAKVPIICGAMTPTEIQTAHETGSDYVKLFPAGSLGLEYIKSILAPMPFIRFVPTGGVSLQNVKAFLEVCPAVGIGGNLVVPKLMAEGRWSELTELARQFSEAAA